MADYALRSRMRTLGVNADRPGAAVTVVTLPGGYKACRRRVPLQRVQRKGNNSEGNPDRQCAVQSWKGLRNGNRKRRLMTIRGR
jgi:hypothetical protein